MQLGAIIHEREKGQGVSSFDQFPTVQQPVFLPKNAAIVSIFQNMNAAEYIINCLDSRCSETTQSVFP
jgi:hypothetical protein